MRLKKCIERDYTTVHNDFLRDKSLSINARGLLITMLSLPDNWNFSIKGLAAILPDGEKKVGSALKELELHGYLVRERIYDNGKLADWNYIISDEKLPEDILSRSGTKSNILLQSQNGDVEKVDVENLHLKNADNQDINKSNTSIINNPSIYPSNVEKSNEYDMVDMIRLIKKNISYEEISMYVDTDMLDEIVLIMSECICSQGDIRVSGKNIPASMVQKRFLKLNDSHIMYVMQCMASSHSKIKNIKAYMITALYNSYSTINSYYRAEANYDMNSSLT